LLIAPVVAAAVFGGAALSLKAGIIAAVCGCAAMYLVGWPLMFWMVDNARTGPLARTLADVFLGAAPFITALVTGIAGFYVKVNSLARLKFAFERAASIPYYGALPWPDFARLTALGIVTGVITMWAARTFQGGTRRSGSPLI